MTTDAGGAGHWRGAPGSLNVKKVLEPTTAMAWMVSADHPLSGMCGGDDASPYSNHFEVGTPNEYKIERTAQAQLPAGAVDRLPARRRRRLRAGAAARSRSGEGRRARRDMSASRRRATKYGVVLTGTLEDYDLAVDVARPRRCEPK